MSTRNAKLLLALAVSLAAFTAVAQVKTYTDNFQNGSSTLQWTPLGNACLTAGNGTGSIPACTGKFQNNGTYTIPANEKKAGQGALLLTPPLTSQTGAVLSAFPPFPLSQGVQITFTTYTFGGSGDGPASNGADGIVFMLTDGTAAQPTTTGGSGGAMGYDCSNTNDPLFNGMANAYIGLGIDEWGNYLNTGDNGSNGVLNSRATGGTTAYGDNPFQKNVNGTPGDSTGKEYQPERIGIRGAGNTTWTFLNTLNSKYYSGSVTYKDSKGNKQNKMWDACKSGKYVSSGTEPGKNLKLIPNYTNGVTSSTVASNYNPIPGSVAVLPANQPIANNSSTATRNPTATTAAGDIAWPITYKLTISPTGLLNFSYSYNNGTMQPVLVNQDITASNGPLPNSLRFGFSAGTGGSYNTHEITCFQAAPLQSNSSAGTNTIQSGEVKTGTQIYLASYAGDTWWGSLQAVSLDTVGGVLTVDPYANWDAKCVLTGGACGTMQPDKSGNPPTITAQAPSARVLLTSDGSGGGIPLEWANLSSAQQASLNTDITGKTDSNGTIRLDWLRGGRSNEQLQKPPGNLRARNYVLGDIIDSSPTWVSAPYPGTYPNAFSDGLYGKASTEPENQSGAQTYGTFAGNNATRLNVVYVGGNDGLLHGFESGSYTAGGTYDSSNNDGKEVLGYMPAGVLANKAVALASPNYSHDYLVDATPAVGDLFYGGAWHTWLVGGVGSSGREIYALDVTDPGNFSETNASSLVIGDWTSASSGLSGLGNTVGTPIIQRMHNGQWAIVFGNGLGGSGNAGVYIGLVDKTSGAVTFQFLDTGVAAGIADVTAVDLDGDSIADYLYAGDTKGNVWRFDVTSNDATKWAASTFGNKTATPLFVATDGATPTPKRQPITTAITATAIQTDGGIRAMLYFGTGQKTPQTATHSDLYATGKQTFYGIWDWDMDNWNSLSSVKYASLAETRSFTRSNLLAQALSSPETPTTGSGSTLVYGTRSLPTGTQVCWQGSNACKTGNTQFGWMFDLPDTNEQIIYNPTYILGAIVVNTAVPPVASTIQCTAGTQSGWTMAFDPASGGGLPQGFFPNSSGAFGTNSDGSTISGVQFNGVGTPTTVTYNDKTYLLTQTVQGSAALTQVNPPIDNKPARASWREIRN